MARSYQNFKQNLNEHEQKLLEIGQLVQPYEKDFLFSEIGYLITSPEYWQEVKSEIEKL